MHACSHGTAAEDPDLLAHDNGEGCTICGQGDRPELLLLVGRLLLLCSLLAQRHAASCLYFSLSYVVGTTLMVSAHSLLARTSMHATIAYCFITSCKHAVTRPKNSTHLHAVRRMHTTLPHNLSFPSGCA